MAVALLAMTTMLAACGQGTSSSSGSTIKVGALLPLSGKNASAGDSNLKGMRMVVDAVNDAGGIKSLDGAKLKLVSADDASDQTKTAEQARRLIQQEHVSFILGPYATPEAEAAVPVSERARMGMLSTQASFDGLFDRGYKYFSTVSMTSSQFGDQYAEFFKWLNKSQHTGIKTLAVTYPDNDYGQTAAKSATKGLDGTGIKVGPSLSYPPDVKDVTPVVQRVKAANPDAVLSIGYLSDGVLLQKARAAQGYTSPPIWVGGSSSFTDDRLWGMLGDAAKPALGGETFGLAQFDRSVSTPGVKWLVDHYKGKTPLDQATAAGAQAAWILVTAMEKSGSKDPAKLGEAIKKVNLPADDKRVSMPQFDNGLSFEPSGRPKEPVGLFVQWTNGHKKVVFPLDLANAKPRL